MGRVARTQVSGKYVRLLDDDVITFRRDNAYTSFFFFSKFLSIGNTNVTHRTYRNNNNTMVIIVTATRSRAHSSDLSIHIAVVAARPDHIVTRYGAREPVSKRPVRGPVQLTCAQFRWGARGCSCAERARNIQF